MPTEAVSFFQLLEDYNLSVAILFVYRRLSLFYVRGPFTLQRMT